MVQRGFCGVNSLSRSQALSRVVEVAQGVFLPSIFGLDLGLMERPLILFGSRRGLDCTFRITDIVLTGIIILSSHYYASRLQCGLLAEFHQRDFELSVWLPRKYGAGILLNSSRGARLRHSSMEGWNPSRHGCLRKRPCEPDGCRAVRAGITNRAFPPLRPSAS
jgi:hypothetical protein